jgi:predicted Fe-Mo cluster-binding NifX family protein
MKTAFAYWDNRIAPVFDVARHIYLAEARTGRIIDEAHEVLPSDPPVQKVLRMVALDVDTLVCGAISRPFHGVLTAHGIKVLPFVAGDLDHVVQAWLSGQLDGKAFTMPGCWRRGHQRFGRMKLINREDYIMNGKKQGSMGTGGGQGRGRGGQRMGRMGGPQAAGPTGYCECPRCGQRAGMPCVEQKCPKCGSVMIRQ